MKTWAGIYEPTTFLVGKTDDLDFYDYQHIALKIYGKIPPIKELDDEFRLRRFMSEARKLRKPKILSTLMTDTEDEKEGVEKIPLGFRFMGQRFIPDSYVFQNLVYPKITLYLGHSKPFTLVISENGLIRGFPRGLDLMAVLGSEYAEEILKKEGDTDYKNYNDQLFKLKKEFNLKKEELSDNLFYSWLYCLLPLLSSSQSNIPPFMTNRAWTAKKLYTALGSWAELRHDTILYAKQSYTMVPTEVHPQILS